MFFPLHFLNFVHIFSWTRILSLIVNLDDVQVINGKLKDKDRNIVKERFSVSLMISLIEQI